MKVIITDHQFEHADRERSIVETAGFEMIEVQCKTEEDLIDRVADADALIVQWAPITANVIAVLSNCKVIVRYGIGVDNIDLEAAKEKGIPVCNIPDYCIDEVADHVMALALAGGRQLKQTEERFKAGTWKIVPPHPMNTFRKMVFATAGYGRIAREVLKRAAGFKFQLAAYDPYVDEDEMKVNGVKKLTIEELFDKADILSLNLPLTDETGHFVNAERLKQMKSTAILVNTARGGLVDTAALANALHNNEIAFAGLDVFEEEPLDMDHSLWKCDNAILTSHISWYSEGSVPKLQELAAEAAVKALKGEALNNQVNQDEDHSV
ncbi:MAG: C-terminal binding protein [Flavobacteriales bacterium]|nr:C-terminal binding protein [Flavobacteriales bacterium]